jgi:hypothetical protein
VAARQAEIANLDATRAVQTALIAQARAGVDASQAELVRAQDDDRRFERLVDRAAVSVQSAEGRGRLPPGRRQQPEGAGRPGRGNPRAGGDRDPAPAGRGRAQARPSAIGAVEPALYRVRAPIDGVVGNRRARPGAYAATASQLMVIVPARGLWIDANFKESQLAGIRPGNAATVEADAVPGRVFHGHVASVAPATGAQFSVLPRRTPPATSPRSSSGCRCASCSIAPMACSTPCGRGCRWWPGWTAGARAHERRQCSGGAVDPAVADEHLFQGIRLWRDVHRHVRGLLDIQIVSASLRDIGGGLSAGNDETTWVQTSYLIAEIIVIPLGMVDAHHVHALAVCVLGGRFHLTSLLCGLAWNIQSMIVFRALQGFWAAR